MTFNNGDEIASCIASLVNAAPSHLSEIFIIDNASSDGTPFLVSKSRALNRFAKFKIIVNGENKGFTAALNQGLALAKAPYVLFLNPDTILQENAIVRMKKYLQKDRKIGVAAPLLRNEDGSIQPSCRRFPRHADVIFELTGLSRIFSKSALFNRWKMGDFDHTKVRHVDQPQGAFLMTRKSVVKKIGAWDEEFPMFFSDVDWCKRVTDAGFLILFTPEVQITHHKGRSVYANRAAMIWSSHKSFIRYFSKHFSKPRWILPNALIAILLVFSGGLRYLAAQLKSLFVGK